MVNEKLSAQGNRSKFSYSAIVQPFTRGKHTYTPSIYLLNSATAKSDLSPIISSGLEIDDEDNILGWQANPDGTFKEIIVSEESSKSTSAPIYIMDIASDIDQKNLQAFLDLSRIEYDNVVGERTMTKTCSYRYRDNMRYDWSGREEFSIAGAALSSGDIGFDYLRICATCITQPFLEMTEIEPGDLNKDLFQWFAINWNVNAPNWQTTNFYFNLFERDWQYSFKLMGNCQKFPGGNIISLAGQTKYEDHWLMYDPVAGLLPALPMSDINVDWLWTASNSKAELDLWRVD